MNCQPPLLLEPRWYEGALLRRHLPAELRAWLLDESSLTRRLQQACGGRFHVELISLAWERPQLNEAQILGVRPWQRALIRQVRLRCDDQPWVFARTVIPISSLRGAQRRLAHLGNRPLGALLFADPALQRSPIQVAHLCAGSQVLGSGSSLREVTWGRRSVFKLHGYPLLVSEFFLPALPPFQGKGHE